ncbi:cysteine--tRNA ligase [Candidatus Pacearchaeota archaeon]|nr:cysteine--tRNA ligase [Candidatus Pacearchaeota archaeon]
MLKFYNTLTRKKEAFKPMKKGKVNMFVCGPTLHDYPHLGNGRTFVSFDVIARYLKWKRYKLFYLQNLTDIDDKIINKARENQVEWKEIKEKYEKIYLQDMKKLNITSVKKYARATDYIKEIISQVKRLIKKKYVYKISDGWYFDLSKDKDYGKLSGRTELKSGDSVSRIDENKEKKNKGDFCVWKFSKLGEPMWKSDIGDGRPGWHIEDTAITEKEFGERYDIHGGGIDLMFPHHEAEISQMESLSGKKPFVRYWLHTGFLNINEEKMSKSLGNFITIKDVHEEAMIVRYFLISNHYRNTINFSNQKMEDARNSYERLKNIVSELKDDKKINKKYLQEFETAMDNDINTPEALQVLWKLLRDGNEEGKFITVKKMDEVFGLNLLKKEKNTIPKEVKKLAKERGNARKNKNWKKADEMREKINKLGYIIEDKERGYVLRKK